jgi:RNA polymerase sigma-54 factor
MAISQRLEFRQSQSLVMTPQLMQAIKLLQLSNVDLAAYVEGELEQNPLLERASDAAALPEPDISQPSGFESPDADHFGGNTENAAASATHEGQATSGDWLDGALETSRAAIEDNLGTGLDNVFPEDSGAMTTRAGADQPPQLRDWEPPASMSGIGPSTDEYNLEAFVQAETTLADHLSQQLAMSDAGPVARLIGQYLIDLVDDAGYLPADLSEARDKLGISDAELEASVAILQQFDPPGICARNLSECLAIQLRERDRYDPAMQALVEHLPLLAKRDHAALRKICGVDDEDLIDMIGEIQKLDPKPGLRFGSTLVQPVVPDVFVKPGPDGGWLVELNSETLPKVLVNQTYYSELSKNIRKDGDKTYFTDCFQNATWLVRALDQRARTILKVSTEIVRQQDAFFTRGVAHLRPLNLKAVAEAIEMHESTVSRVTANKYMACNRGIFELKYFFTASIASSDGGEAHSAEAVRHHIRQMIDAESPRDILSDDTIVDKLRESGIEIARRTVAKYREAMRIPSSVQRRREKQHLLKSASKVENSVG